MHFLVISIFLYVSESQTLRAELDSRGKTRAVTGQHSSPELVLAHHEQSKFGQYLSLYQIKFNLIKGLRNNEILKTLT